MSYKPWTGGNTTVALRECKAAWSETDERCVICKQPIDYQLKYPSPESCSIEHVKPRAEFPELIWDPANWAPAHLRCNTQKGRGTAVDLGITSRIW